MSKHARGAVSGGVFRGAFGGASGGAFRGAIDAERIRLAASRSTWCCLGVAVALALGSALLAARVPESEGKPVTVADSVAGLSIGEMVILVVAALSVTGEYKYRTVRLAYQAIPVRRPFIAAKALLLAATGGVLAVCLALASFGVTALTAAPPVPRPDTAGEWVVLLGTGVTWSFAAVVGVSVGTLVRNGAGATSALLIWAMVGESGLGLVPRVGGFLAGWSPFTAVGALTNPDAGSRVPYGSAGAVVYALLVAGGLLALALLAAVRRDP
ncbi:hypothetical protein [Actinomadura terrae]|uniref:hypothetical protein n=1 Tax=Actinomadura terrae TaxID=604353 RepID=UPI001FA7BB62|nr:hypothetical protein [Actinomadura terrae]